MAGNCDFSDAPYHRVVRLKNVTFFITHGHRYNVDEGLEMLLEAAKVEHSDVVLFGHTHRETITRIDNILVANPGSAMLGAKISSCLRILLSDGVSPVLQLVYDENSVKKGLVI